MELPQKPKNPGLRFSSLFFRLSTKEKMIFARNLDLMTRSGMQLLPSLEILKKQTRSKVMTTIIDQLIDDVRNGHFLSYGLARYRTVFGDFFINVIKVGESSGTLSDNLKYLAEELAKREELQNKVRGAMAYPFIILLATVGITSLLSFVIFPKILPVLKGINVELPLTTVIFIAVSDFLLNYGVWVLLGLVVLAISFVLLLRLPSFKHAWHSFLLVLPIVKNMVKNYNLITFSRTLSLLLHGGIQIVEALDITADTMTNLIYRDELKSIADGVRKGDPISKYLIRDEFLFPPTFSQLVMVGENTGKLDETVLFLAEFYESELDASVKTMSTVLEPLLLLIMGGMVAFIALAIITPIYKITQTLGR